MGDIDWFLRQYKELPDIKKVLAEMGETDRKATCGAFILRVLRDAPENIKGKISKFKAKIDEIAGDFRFDIQTFDEIAQRFKYYEFKSWGSIFSFKTDQFAAYLAKIQSLSDLNYLFQKRDAIVDVTSIKDKIMNQLRKDENILKKLSDEQKVKLFNTLEMADILNYLDTNFSVIFKVI